MVADLRAMVLVVLLSFSVWEVGAILPWMPVVMGMQSEPALRQGWDNLGRETPDMGIYQWLFTQGGMAAAMAMLLYFWRRDMKERIDATKADALERIAAVKNANEERLVWIQQETGKYSDREQILISVIERNTKALTESSEAKNRLARAVEMQTARGRKYDEMHDGKSHE